MKKILFISLIVLVGVTLSACSKNDNSGTSEGKPLFFVSKTCGHCKEVKDYIRENDIKDKVSYTEIEAFANRINNNLFNEKAEVCGIPEKQRGVPLLFDDGKCYVGAIKVKNYFKEKAGL